MIAVEEGMTGDDSKEYIIEDGEKLLQGDNNGRCNGDDDDGKGSDDGVDDER
ncbi:hypothetical protein B296_00046602 [Ensete ventricosum]|uniref:Uncharacterized protein n=1 Tax=Ensete ventricosum TaxID=4639 RepID=A0A426XFN8_ENSVE|nr:hypothetical protein B296_00046602 [Ensete ventricosum]